MPIRQKIKPSDKAAVEAVKANILSTVSLLGVTGTRPRKTMGVIGDSISNDLPLGLHFLPQAAFLMQQRCQAEVSYAVSTITDSMVANQLPQAIRSGLDIVVIHGGVNDITTDVTAATIEANIQTMAEGLLAAGIRPVLTTVLINSQVEGPWDAAKFAVWAAVNAWIRAYAAATAGVLLADFALACIDIPAAPDLPAWKTGHSTDLLHPTYPGYWAMAGSLATLLAAQADYPASIRPTAALAALPSVVILTNPLMTGILGESYGDAVTGVWATNWMTQHGDAGTTVEKATRTDVDGAWQVLNVAEGDTNLVLRYGTAGTPSITLLPGIYEFFAEVNLAGATWAAGTLGITVVKLSGDGTLTCSATEIVVTETPTTGKVGIIRSQRVTVMTNSVLASVTLSVGAFVDAVKVGAVWAKRVGS
jgi:lysophospholipase L1-like esterase